MKKVVGAMMLVSAVMAKEPNMQLIEQQIMSNDITIKSVYEAPPVVKKKKQVDPAAEKLKGILAELAAASIHIVRVGEAIQFVIPTEALFNGTSNDIAPKKMKTLGALKQLVTVGEKHPVNIYALGKTRIASELVYVQAVKLLNELGQIGDLKTGLAMISTKNLTDHKDLPFWKVVKPGSNVICIEYQLKGGQKFFNG